MKLKNYLLAGTALVALSFMAACSEDETIQTRTILRILEATMVVMKQTKTSSYGLVIQ